jgi:hypothetical protein
MRPSPTISAADHASLQDALDALPDAGGAIYLPTGTYHVASTLTRALVEGQHLFLYGDGRGSVLVNDNRDGQALLHLTGVVGSWWPDLKITVRDLTLVGNHDSGDGLVLDYPNDALVDACFFSGHGGTAVRLGPQGTNVTVRDCWMRDCKRALRADNIHHLTFHGNQTRSQEGGQQQAEHVFLGWECREVRLVANHLAYGQAQAIILDGTAQHVIANNTIEGFPIAIEARGKGETNPPDHCRDMVISGNYLHADTGVLLKGQCRGFVINGNTFINNPVAAVQVQDGAHGGGHAIAGNVIRKSVYDGVYVKSASPEQGGIELGEAKGCVVTGNVLDGITS